MCYRLDDEAGYVTANRWHVTHASVRHAKFNRQQHILKNRQWEATVRNNVKVEHYITRDLHLVYTHTVESKRLQKVYTDTYLPVQ